MCQGLIPDRDIDVLKSALQIGGPVSETTQRTLSKWQAFDKSLRNELVRARAGRKKLDPLKYLRGDGYTESTIVHVAMTAARNLSIIEAEEELDRMRWQELDELAFGHYFDIDFLIVYCLKLQILERWERIKTADKEKVLEEHAHRTYS